MEDLLRRISLDDIKDSRMRARDAEAEESASRIIADVASRGEAAVREWAVKLGDIDSGRRLILDKEDLEKALESIDSQTRKILEAARDRITAFASAQRGALRDIDIPVPGGRAGHSFIPVGRAGCYAPGGRFPLPSSALMTACTARAAGVGSVWCLGPKPSTATLAAAALAGAEGFLAAGGAQGIAALAFGAGVPPCDVIVGPGGRYAAAAKRLLFGVIGTEAPAGPSELLVIASPDADPEIVAADLLAQAEHDVVAIPAVIVLGFEDSVNKGITSNVLNYSNVGEYSNAVKKQNNSDVSSDRTKVSVRGDVNAWSFSTSLNSSLARRLDALPEPNRTVARRALQNGWLFVAANEDEVLKAAERFAPEHLEIFTPEPQAWAERIRTAGAVFLGPGSAEVFGDYGAGPNHCLPTGGAARFAAGLSVLSFLRARTWLEMDDPSALSSETAAFARIEGLEAHARAAELRTSLRRGI
jgi:phosphoribosyl-ATP pyrophosphohydrolase/phosphoribosyl-AMP cyclohydrolase/histidinol dehydrogenase